MISVLICSRNAVQREHIQRNVRETIGDLPFEIITVNNEENSYSLLEAYNLLAGKARYPVFCFMHDDLTIHTSGWGELVVELMADQKMGVLGLAGSAYKSEIPSPWWFSTALGHLSRSYVIQQGQDTVEQQDKSKKGNARLEKVVVVDGVWFCCKKSLWEQNQFDEATFQGFHFYDLDFCMQAHAKGYVNYITNSIFVEHQSSGRLNKEWMRGAMKFHRKWRAWLPATVVEVTKAEKAAIQKEMIENWLVNLYRYAKDEQRSWLKYWLRYFARFPYRRNTYSLLYQKVKQTVG